MANMIKNGEGVTLVDWSAINTSIYTGFNISKGSMTQTITVSDADKSTNYKLSYNAKEIRDSKSYFLLTVSLVTGGHNTCFVPIQFGGLTEIPLIISEDVLTITFEIVGDLIISDLVMDADSVLTPQDRLNLVKVSENGAKWDKVIEFTSATGKLKADMLEGLINTTLNRFANTSGTIVQENGETLYLNGTTVENSTAATKLGSSGLLIADSKDVNDAWEWVTAVSGAGISAAAIVTGILSAITISGVNIVSSTITSTTITGVTIEGSTIYSGDRINGNYVKIDSGLLEVYRNNFRTFFVTSSEDGTMYLDPSSATEQGLAFNAKQVFDGVNYASVRSLTDGLRFLCGNSYINLNYSGTIDIHGTINYV